MDMNTFLSDMSAETHWTGNGMTISVIQSPGKKVSLDCRRSTDEQLLSDLTQMVCASFGTVLNEDSSDGTRSHVDGVDGLAIVHDSERALGFASGLFPREDMFYLHGIALSPQIKGSGFSRLLVQSLLDRVSQKKIVCTTQNPLVFRLLNSLFENVYPNPHDEIPEALRCSAERLMGKRSENFNSATGIARSLYGDCLYEEIPSSGNEELDNWFRSALNVQDGRTRDAFLLIGSSLKS